MWTIEAICGTLTIEKVNMTDIQIVKIAKLQGDYVSQKKTIQLWLVMALFAAWMDQVIPNYVTSTRAMNNSLESLATRISTNPANFQDH